YWIQSTNCSKLISFLRCKASVRSYNDTTRSHGLRTKPNLKYDSNCLRPVSLRRPSGISKYSAALMRLLRPPNSVQDVSISCLISHKFRCGFHALPRMARTLVDPVLGTSTKIHLFL